MTKKKLERQPLENILGTQDNMYVGHLTLDPDTTVTLEDIVVILRAMEITFSPEAFAKLPPEVRKHFIVHDRNGNDYRYGRKPRHLRG